MKKTLIFCIFVLILAFVTPLLPVSGEGRVYTDTIRLHVLANSDSESDQTLKLAVRDAVLEKAAVILDGAENRTEAERRINENLGSIQKTAEDTVRENGYAYRVRAVLGTEHYPERGYDGVRLPAGDYLSLRIMIGEAEGHNWWCVLYPPLCTSPAEPQNELADAGFTGEQIRVLCDDDHPKYVLKFRFLEILADIFG